MLDAGQHRDSCNMCTSVDMDGVLNGGFVPSRSSATAANERSAPILRRFQSRSSIRSHTFRLIWRCR